MAYVITAVATAVELGTVAAIATAVSEVGIALTVVGAVTGSKDLMKIGGVLSLVGGVGSLAASFASTAADAGATTLAEGAADTAASAIDPAASSADYVNALDAQSDAASQALGTQASGAAAQTGADLAPELSSSATTGSVSAPTGSTSDLAPQMQTAATAQTPSLGPQGPDGALAPTGAQAPVTPADSSVGGRLGPDNIDVGGGFSPATGNGSLFDQFSGWVKNNPKLAEIGMQVVGGGLKGMSDYSLTQQKLAQQQQLINMQSYGNQVGTWAPTTPVTGIVGGGAK